MSSQNARRLSTSIATVGSSRNRRSGSPAIAIANRTRCASPPDRVSARRPASAEAGRSRTGSRGVGFGESAPCEVDELADARAGQAAAWSIAPTRPARTAGRAEAERRRPRRGRREQAEHDRDRGGLAGAVRAQEGDGLAAGDGRGLTRRGRALAEGTTDAVELDGGDVGGESRVGVFVTMPEAWSGRAPREVTRVVNGP